eukprot:9224833-Pyramimonas_sp.AAC.1
MLADAAPASYERRAFLARDPLAGVDGFRVVLGLVFEYIIYPATGFPGPGAAHFSKTPPPPGTHCVPEGLGLSLIHISEPTRPEPI